MEATLVVLHASVNSKPFHVNYNNANLKTRARSCYPPFAVITVTVASQGETLLLTLFSFCGESDTSVSDWTHLSGRFRDWDFWFPGIAC